VAAILANPRYTGRQVWNRQYTDHDPPSGADPRSARGKVLRWNTADQWVISKDLAHQALVSEADFVAAQQISAMPGPQDGAPHGYVFVGLLRCGNCGRRFDSHWVHGRPGYRCRHGHTTANRRGSRAVKTFYLREDRILERIRNRLTRHGMHAADPQTIAYYLRANNLIVTCTTRTCIIEDANKDLESDENGERRTAPTSLLSCGKARLSGRFVGVCVSKDSNTHSLHPCARRGFMWFSLSAS
jgi:hypothetical protein